MYIGRHFSSTTDQERPLNAVTCATLNLAFHVDLRAYPPDAVVLTYEGVAITAHDALTLQAEAQRAMLVPWKERAQIMW